MSGSSDVAPTTGDALAPTSGAGELADPDGHA
jgi:hypothetical protein